MRQNRKSDQLREIEIIPNFNAHAEGSCLIKAGNTHVLCTATVDTHVPRWLKGQGRGWVTAEYGMLPRSTHDRINREAKRGQTGRTQEIQRLIGRALRASVDLKKLGERQIVVDCDVLQADGGTRTASITGGFVALKIAIDGLIKHGLVRGNPIVANVAAVSCGIVSGQALLDLDYDEDSSADTDANFVLASDGKLVEIQATAEENTFSEQEFTQMLGLAKQGVAELFAKQNKAVI